MIHRPPDGIPVHLLMPADRAALAESEGQTRWGPGLDIIQAGPAERARRQRNQPETEAEAARIRAELDAKVEQATGVCFQCGGTAWRRVVAAGEQPIALRCVGCGRERRVQPTRVLPERGVDDTVGAEALRELAARRR